jgi:hypothetical protein
MNDTLEYTASSSEDDERRSSTTKQRNLKRNSSAATSKEKRPRSASDVPTSRKRFAPLKPDELYVDWANDKLISHSRWGQDKLYRYLPVVEMDKLVGWATHMNSYQSISTTNGGDHASSTLQAHERPLPRSTNNPLLGLPNLPLRPSLLNHLVHDLATKLAVAKVDQSGASKRSRKRPKSSCYFERFQHSAAVAVGMLAEEMITASLLPLARQHVARCRRQENVADWTLPPEEAIYKLLQDSDMSGNDPHRSSSSLLTSRIPTRSTVPGETMPGERVKLALEAWCRSRDVDPQTLKKDEEMFELLLQMPKAPSQVDPYDTFLDSTVPEESSHCVSYEV